ncbi:hypothetical protein BDV34DRAFT_90508 [Aspergillus parasiticus]|uniref:Uncharacterized protein n=1 Tax=Aspergillus parasiticus TaxID=5067 RepID=A0A5N6DLZ1_ASPPA|nr:hypothetical protein BDV34DRAFT_90508 [Aspergillus parasiticus]
MRSNLAMTLSAATSVQLNSIQSRTWDHNNQSSRYPTNRALAGIGLRNLPTCAPGKAFGSEHIMGTKSQYHDR